jgi:hypothetical protein
VFLSASESLGYCQLQTNVEQLQMLNLQQQQELTIHNLNPAVGKQRQQNMLDFDQVNDAEFYKHNASGENAARKSLVFWGNN